MKSNLVFRSKIAFLLISTQFGEPGKLSMPSVAMIPLSIDELLFVTVHSPGNPCYLILAIHNLCYTRKISWGKVRLYFLDSSVSELNVLTVIQRVVFKLLMIKLLMEVLSTNGCVKSISKLDHIW